MGAVGQDRVESYLDRLAVGRPGDWGGLIEGLTVGETYFFRYRDHFRAFSEVVLAECADMPSPSRPLRILSAGAATGEEAYSLAISVLENGPMASRGVGAAVLGIDVNPQTIARAVRGTYSPWSLRDTPADLRDRYFAVDGRGHRIRDEVRTLVSFEERNLVIDDPSFWRPESFDVVFCRNVLMYMTPEAMHAIVERIARALRPGGFLFLGHAETLRGISQDFHLRHTHETFYYARRKPGAREERPHFVAETLPRYDGGLARSSAGAALRLDDPSWVDAIARASERVAAIVDRAPVRASEGAPASSPPPPGAPGAPMGRQGVLRLMREERFAEAIGALGRLHTSAGPDPEARLLRAVVLTNAGRFGDAEEACRELLAVDALSAGATYLTALCREHAGDLEGAIDCDQTASYLAPGFVMPRLHLGLLERRAGRLARARVELRQALVLLPAEDESRILLFGGGFGREALAELCRSELRRCGGEG
jgi:chemotaxis protein methyltransferase CheR